MSKSEERFAGGGDVTLRGGEGLPVALIEEAGAELGVHGLVDCDGAARGLR